MRTTMRFLAVAALCSCAALAARADKPPPLVNNATTPCVRACGPAAGGPEGAGGKPEGNTTKAPGPKAAKMGNATAARGPAGNGTELGGNGTAGPKGPRGNATAPAKGAKLGWGGKKGAKLGGNVTTRVGTGKGAKMGNATAKGPNGKGAKMGNTAAKGPTGKGAKMGNATAKGGKAPKQGKARNVTTMEVSLPMPPGDCEKQTAAEVKVNIGVIANATGQAALLDLAASEGKCTAAASASSRARRATKDNFAVSLAFKDAVTPAQYASAVEATSAVIAAGNFSVSLGVGGTAKTVVMPSEAKVTQGIRAAMITEAGGSGPEDPGEAEGSGAGATGGAAALLSVALAITGLV